MNASLEKMVSLLLWLFQGKGLGNKGGSAHSSNMRLTWGRLFPWAHLDCEYRKLERKDEHVESLVQEGVLLEKFCRCQVVSMHMVLWKTGKIPIGEILQMSSSFHEHGIMED